MLYTDRFPRPVSILPDEQDFESVVLVHREVPIEHIDSELCPCMPRRYTATEIAHPDALAVLNAQLRIELQ